MLSSDNSVRFPRGHKLLMLKRRTLIRLHICIGWSESVTCHVCTCYVFFSHNINEMLILQGRNAFFQEFHSHPYIPNQNTDMTIAIVQKQVRTYRENHFCHSLFKMYVMVFHKDHLTVETVSSCHKTFGHVSVALINYEIHWDFFYISLTYHCLYKLFAHFLSRC